MKIDPLENIQLGRVNHPRKSEIKKESLKKTSKEEDSEIYDLDLQISENVSNNLLADISGSRTHCSAQCGSGGCATAGVTCKGTCRSCGATCLGTCINCRV